MSKHIKNVNPVLFDARYTKVGVLEILYENVALTVADDEVFLLIEKITATQMKIADFMHTDKVLHNVHAFSVLPGGDLSVWTRIGKASDSPIYTQSQIPNDDFIVADFIALAVAVGTPAPRPTTQAQGQAQGGRLIRVKIRKDDVRPIAPFHRSRS